MIARVAQYNGLLRSLPLKTMSPWHPATRAEAAAFLYNVMGTDPSGLNGRYLGDSSDLVRYFLSQHPQGGKFTVSLPQLAKYYVLIGNRFGIRADMAWAQMINETNFGQYGGVVKPAQNNFGSIGATGPTVPGYSFKTAELGVIAQFAHLAWYTYPANLDDPASRLVNVPMTTVIDTPVILGTWSLMASPTRETCASCPTSTASGRSPAPGMGPPLRLSRWTSIGTSSRLDGKNGKRLIVRCLLGEHNEMTVDAGISPICLWCDAAVEGGADVAAHHIVRGLADRACGAVGAGPVNAGPTQSGHGDGPAETVSRFARPNMTACPKDER